jgi:bacterial/archaeal transporter family-2 protein
MPHPPRLIDLMAAFGTGGLLTLMILFNGQMGAATTPFFSSLAAHGMGTIAALGLLGLVWLRRGAVAPGGRAPWWSYLAGCVGAVTVMLTSVTVNGALALSGTLALGLAGQVAFGLAADRFGLFGLARRRPGRRDALSLALICAGSLIIIFFGAAP